LQALHGIDPKQVLFIGNDMRNDIHPAQLSGSHTVLFAGDQRSLRRRDGDPQLRGLHPDRVLNQLDQLPTLLRVDA
jgi:putative hydrolase of the HAD superfamily